MRSIFVSVWIIAIVCVSAFVWMLRVPHTNQHVFYTSLISDGDAVSGMTIFGKTWIENETTIVPIQEGTVTDVLVKPGDSVLVGQVIATLDFQANDLLRYEEMSKLVQETGSINKLNQTLAEISKLENSGYYDAVEAAKKRSEIYSSISQLMNYRSQLQKEFEKTHGKILRAPFDGVVTDVRLKVGQRISLRDDKIDISILVAPKSYKVGIELEVSDELLYKIKKDQEISVNVPLSLEENYKGKITAISHQAYDDKKRRFFKVLASIEPEKKRNINLASGMKVVVDVKTSNEEDLTWIPKAALDIYLDEKHISSKMSYVRKRFRGIASSKVADFKTDDTSQVDGVKDQLNVTKLVGNDVFPQESKISEIYILTADNRVVQANIQTVREAGEMVAVEGKELRGMRVITHYRPKDTIW